MNRASNRRSGAQAEEWREIALPEAQRKSLPRLGFSCTAAEHWVYVIGGRRSKQGESPTEYLRDVLRYNCLDNTWEELDPLPAPARSDHSAVLVGSKIWVLGGQLEKSFCDSVACLDTDTLVWTVLEFRGQHLLTRCAHAAVQHPTKAEAILVFAGYGYHPQPKETGPDWLADLLLVRLDKKEVQALSPKGPALNPRGYHAMAAVGRSVYTFGGRRHSVSDSMSETEALSIYDSEANTWLIPRQVAGKSPSVRSSLQATAYCTRHDEWHMVVHGGLHGKQRLDDCHILAVTAGGKRLAWSKLTASNAPPGRSAHGLAHYRKPSSVVLLCMAGNGTTGHGALGDLWTLELPIAPAQAPAASAELVEVPARPSAGTWKSKRPLAAAPGDGPALKMAATKPAHQRGSGPSSGHAAAAAPAVPYAELQAHNQALQAQVQQQGAGDELQRRNLKESQDRNAELLRQVADADKRLKASISDARRQGELCERHAAESATFQEQRDQLHAQLQRAAAQQQALEQKAEASADMVRHHQALLQEERAVAQHNTKLQNDRSEEQQARHKEALDDSRRRLAESEQRCEALTEKQSTLRSDVQVLQQKLRDTENVATRDKTHADLAEDKHRRDLQVQDQALAALRDQLKAAEAAAATAAAARTQAAHELGEMRDAHLKAAQAQTRLEAQLQERATVHEQLAAAHLKLQERCNEHKARGEREARAHLEDSRRGAQEAQAQLTYWTT